MNDTNIYRDISERTGGDIYIGVVGPVRTGKSTFIKKFMETLVIPHIKSEFMRERATDELPQSAAGKTIMTTEPKFIPEEAVSVELEDSAAAKVRLIDCVGYIVPSSLGYFENEAPRMVRTPWFEDEVPFNMAAELGTRKVINEHSTIGLVVTTDGSITEIPREEYEEAEERVIEELKEINKPFIVILNSMNPTSTAVLQMSAELESKYGVPVCPVNCLDMNEAEIRRILEKVLFEIPVREIGVELPKWLTSLDKNHPIRKNIFDSIRDAASSASKISQVSAMTGSIIACEYVDNARLSAVELGKGSATICVSIKPGLFYQVLGETTGIPIADEAALMANMMELADIKKKYDKIRNAMDEVEATGYGIVMPELEEMTLEEPEIIKQGGKFGIRLKAGAPSIHMMRTKITTEVTPIVGSEQQSEELVHYLLTEFEENPAQIWESNIFGKSLHELVNEGLHNKLYRMPEDARNKVKETIERIINEGCNGLICIIL